jgi:steroid delta-isomerase-like uncharacterized protein
MMSVGKDLWNELVTRYNKHDWSGAASVYATDAVLVDPNGRCEGRDAIDTYFHAMADPFPDKRLQTSLLMEEDDRVVAEWTWRGSNTGPLTRRNGSKIPATGKSVELSGVSVITVRDGKFAIQHDYIDSAAMRRQLA